MVVEWRFHSRQAGTTRKAANPQTGGRRPKKRLLRQVSPPGARGTVASLLVHVPAALRECRAHGPHTRRAPPAGDRPKERRAPSLGLEGTNPRTGRRYFLNKKRLNDLTKLLEDDVSEVVWRVPFWFGGLVFLCLFIYSWFLSLLLLRFGLVGGFQHSRGFPLGPGWQRHERSYNFHRSSSVSLRWAGVSRFRFATVGAPSSVPFGTGGGNLQRHLARVQKVVFSLSCTSISFLGISDGRLPLDRGSFV